MIVAPWKFDVLKASIFVLEALLLWQMFVLRTSNFPGQLSADSSMTETLYCLIEISSSQSNCLVVSHAITLDYFGLQTLLHITKHSAPLGTNLT